MCPRIGIRKQDFGHLSGKRYSENPILKKYPFGFGFAVPASKKILLKKFGGTACNTGFGFEFARLTSNNIFFFAQKRTKRHFHFFVLAHCHMEYA